MKFRILVFFVFILSNGAAQLPDTVRYTEIIGFTQKKTVVVPPTDTSHFVIFLKDKKTSVRLKGVWATLSSDSELDKFIFRNQEEISHKKIVFVASSKLKYAEYSFVLDDLKKYDLMLFYVSPTD